MGRPLLWEDQDSKNLGWQPPILAPGEKLVHYVIEAKHFIFITVCIFAALCMCGGFLKTFSLCFWPLMCHLVDRHREREKTREPRQEPDWNHFPTFLRELVKLALWGVLGLGILWSIRACSKAIVKPDRHPPAYYDPNP
jgi:nitrate reductase NapE component